MQVQKKM